MANRKSIQIFKNVGMKEVGIVNSGGICCAAQKNRIFDIMRG